MGGNQLPRGWSTRSVGQVFDMQLGKMLSKEASAGSHQRAYLANRHVQWDYVDLDELNTMSFTPAEREKYALSPGDLLVCEGGEVGRTALWRGERGEVYFQKAIHRLRPSNQEVLSRYMLRFMRFAADRGLFSDLSSQTSITHLTQEKLAQLAVPLPPPPEQHRIAEILDTIDEAIRKAEQVIAKLQQMKQGLLHDLLTRGIDENGESRDPERHPEQFKDSPLGCIPKGWELLRLGEVIRRFGGLIQTGPFGSQLHANEYVEVGVPVVMPQDIRDDGIDLSNIARITDRKAAELGRHRMQGNDAVFARRGDLSRCLAVSEDEVGWLCGTGCLLVRVPESKAVAGWLTAVYRHDLGQRQVLARAVGSTMVNLNGSILAALHVPLPPVSEQRHFVEEVRSLGVRVATEANGLAKLRSLKQGLMDDLLTGRVRVSVPEEAA